MIHDLQNAMLVSRDRNRTPERIKRLKNKMEKGQYRYTTISIPKSKVIVQATANASVQTVDEGKTLEEQLTAKLKMRYVNAFNRLGDNRHDWDHHFDPDGDMMEDRCDLNLDVAINEATKEYLQDCLNRSLRIQDQKLRLNIENHLSQAIKKEEEIIN